MARIILQMSIQVNGMIAVVAVAAVLLEWTQTIGCRNEEALNDLDFNRLAKLETNF